MAEAVSASSTIKGSARHCFFVLLFYSLLFTAFFSPVLFSDSLLAPGGNRLGDGLLYHLAYFQSSKVSWDTLLAAGFPMTADPQVMSWYPPSVLLSRLPGGWNIFVVSAYVLASCFAHGYVYTLTESHLAGLVSGITYGMCGFMIAQLGHTAIIHTAVWLPLLVWSLEMLRRKFSAGWFAVGCFSVACSVLAGHSQIVAYSLTLSASYALVLGWRATTGRSRFYLISLLLFILGLGLAALQILPTIELATLSERAAYGFSDYISYSLPPWQIPLIIFPAAFGGLAHYGATPYFGEWNLTELTGYVGLLPLMLAAIGFVVARRKRIAIFWLGVVVLAFLLTLGAATPLASLAYRLPVINKFRAPARHFIEMALAVSVLCGLGVEAILRRKATRALALRAVSIAALLIFVCMIALLSKHGTAYAFENGVVYLNALPWANAAVATPLLVFLAGCASLLFWERSPASLFRQSLLLLVLILDLGSFGWFYSWHDYSPRKAILTPPVFAANYRDTLVDSNQRMLSVRGTLGTTSELPPNLSRLWGLPSATGYSPLILSRMVRLLSMLPDASVDSSWNNPDDQSLNLLAVRYVFLPRSQTITDERGISWQKEDMNLGLGSGCNQPQIDAVSFNLPTPVQATAIGIVSRLMCSVGVPEGTEVLRIFLTEADGSVHTQSLIAGRDTAEWAYDSNSVKPQMQHRRAPVFSSFPARMGSEKYEAHDYFAIVNLSGVKDISSIRFQWVGQAGAISIQRVDLINEPAQKIELVNSLETDSSRWRYVGEAGEARVYENLRAMPRAWLVSEVLTVEPDEAINAIKRSRLPDGRLYEPSRLALIEEPLSLTTQDADGAATAQLTRLSDTTMEIHTDSTKPAFLVSSDIYYPGWQARLDGTPVHLFRANYALRGVQIPAGQHVVRFDFSPKSFYYGLAISAFSLCALVGLLWLRIFQRRPAESELSVDSKHPAE